jgi:hemerythrin-like domain-containing protein
VAAVHAAWSAIDGRAVRAILLTKGEVTVEDDMVAPAGKSQRRKRGSRNGARMKAIAIILDEHRSLAAVLHGMLYLVRAISDGRASPDFKLFGAMVYYIDAFPERFHHPKEEAYLFRLLRLRHPAASALLDRLHEEHVSGELKIREVELALRRYEHGGADHFAQFAAAIESYALFHWGHMRAEEDEVLPLARQYLSPADWDEIDDAFAGNGDPMLGIAAGDEYEALFRRIAHLAPPPIGVGPER